MSGKSVELRRCPPTVAETGQPGGKGWVRLSPRGVQEGQEVDPAQPPVQAATWHVRASPVPGRYVYSCSQMRPSPYRYQGGRLLPNARVAADTGGKQIASVTAYAGPELGDRSGNSVAWALAETIESCVSWWGRRCTAQRIRRDIVGCRPERGGPGSVAVVKRFTGCQMFSREDRHRQSQGGSLQPLGNGPTPPRHWQECLLPCVFHD
jgi:hypothetical protein